MENREAGYDIDHVDSYSCWREVGFVFEVVCDEIWLCVEWYCYERLRSVVTNESPQTCPLSLLTRDP